MSATTTATTAASSNRKALVGKYLKALNTSWKLRFYFISKLPTLWFWGVRVKDLSTSRTELTIPYSWWTQNPFRSIYFAAQCGAAELSTGLMAMLALQGRGKISMLITNVEAEFVKKANTVTTFICDEGEKLDQAVQEAVASGEGKTVRVCSIGKNTNGEIVSKIYFTWSFYKKQ